MKFKLIYIATILILLFSSCSEETTEPTTTTDPGINNYIVSLPKWDIFCPPKADENIQNDATTSWECATKVIESKTPCSITRTPADIVTYDPNSEILYLGSLIQGKRYMNGLGSIQSLPINQRAPIKISISFQMANNSRTIEHPSLTTVRDAIGDLVETAQNAGHVSGSSIFFNKSTSYSVEQTALALGLSAKFMIGSVHSSLQWNSTTETHTVSAYFIQKMFTVSMEIPQRPGDFFSSAFTRELLDEQISLGRIGPDNLPVYVSNMVYGRMMTLTMTSTYVETEMKAALEASYLNIGGTVSAEHLEVLNNSEINLVTIGGDANQALAYLRTGNLGEFFKEDAPLTTAVPISYTLRNVGDNVIAKVSETTEYDMLQYDDISVSNYYNEGLWKNAVQSVMSFKKWEVNWYNVLLADEHAIYENCGAVNCSLGKIITLHGDQNGSYPFTFYLESKDPTIPAGQNSALVYNDNESSCDYCISIGDCDNWEDDDFEIGVSGNVKVYAIAFVMINNSTSGEEYFEVHAEDKNGQLCQIEYHTEGINGFFGIISPVPITKIFFNEDDDADDIQVGDLYFGYK